MDPGYRHIEKIPEKPVFIESCELLITVYKSGSYYFSFL